MKTRLVLFFSYLVTSNHTPILNMNEKTQTEIVAELQQQLIAMSRELTEYRKEIDPLRKENATIPELKSRVHSLEKKALEHQINISQSFATVPNGSPDTSSMDDEVNRLRLALAHQKAVEAHLCQELVSLRSTLGNHELSCKKIISACCNVPLQHVEELLQPLLEALESDDFNLDMTLITNFLAKIRSENATTSNVPSEYAESTNSFMM
jgi:molybdopterin converting factor small subunit